ncbi:hypothetical protein N0V85_006878 [Neurospora sp. IMI 360204]|nr:hypothetical protein N0V85_006878 [Neurospora sp. IMI 360204]
MSKQGATSSASTPPRDIACVNRYQQTVNAILSKPASVIRTALHQLHIYTRDNEALQSRIYELVTGVSAPVESNENEQNALPSPTKRMRETSVREPVDCVRCGEKFNLYDKAKGTLKFNRHSMAWEKEAIIDTDEYSSKELDTAINRKLYPNGFRWTCCGQPGGARGCEWYKHKADEGEDTDETSTSSENGENGDGDEGDEGDESGDGDEGHEGDKCDDNA